MKTSNKILIGLLLTAVICMGSVPITLHWKWKHNDVTLVNSTEVYPANHYFFKGEINHVVLRNVTCTILPSPSCELEVEKSLETALQSFQHQDTLFITHAGNSEASPKIRLFLTPVQEIIATDSKILLRGTLEIIQSQSYRVRLVRSNLSVPRASEGERVFQFFDELTLTGEGASTVNLDGALRMNNLSVKDITQFSSGSQISVKQRDFTYTQKNSVKSSSIDGKMTIDAK